MKKILFIVLLVTIHGTLPAKVKKSKGSQPGTTMLAGDKPHSQHTIISPYANSTEWITDDAAKMPWKPSHSSVRLFLNDLWKSHFTQTQDKEFKEFYKAMYDVSTWKTIAVPEQRNTLEESDEYSIKYYRRTIDVPSSWNGRNAYLHFGALSGKVTVWVNGKKAGDTQNKNELGEAELDITRCIRPGNENLIALELHEKRSAGQPFGIYGDIYLEARRTAFVEDIMVESYFNEDLSVANLVVNVQAMNMGKPTTVSPIATLYAPDGSEVAHTVASTPELKKKKGGKVQLKLLVLNPYLWTDETPFLYTLNVTLGDEIFTQKYGIRLMNGRDGTFHMNNRPITIQCADMSDAGIHDRGVNLIQQWEKDIQTIKDLNLNAVCVNEKTCDPRLYALCDHYGLYVLNHKKNETYYDISSIRDQAKHADIKKTCRKVSFKLEGNRLIICNNHTFTSLKNYRIHFTLIQKPNAGAAKGDVLMQGHQDLPDVQPGNNVALQYPLPPVDKRSVAILNVTLEQKNTTPWTKAGMVVAEESIRIE